MADHDRIIRICDRVMFAATCALIYFLPITSSLMEWSFGFMLLSYLTKRTVQYARHLSSSPKSGSSISLVKRLTMFFSFYKPVTNSLNKAIGIYTGIGFLAVIFSAYPLHSLAAFVFKLLECVFIFFLAVECLNSRKRLNIFIVIFLVSIALIGVNGIYQFVTGEGFIRHRILPLGSRVISTFKHPNDFGGYLIVAVSLLTSMLFFRQGGNKKADVSSWHFAKSMGLAFVFIISLNCLGLTFSRGAWIGFFFSMFVLSLAKKDKFYLPIVIAVAFFAVYYPVLKTSRNVSFVSDDAKAVALIKEKERAVKQSIGDSLVTGDVQEPEIPEPIKAQEYKPAFTGMGRTSWWGEAMWIILDSPIVGKGLNTYSKVAVDYKLSWRGYPHNSYIHLTVEMGLLGLFSIIWVFLCLSQMSMQYLRSASGLEFKAVAMGCLAGLVGFWAHSFVDTNFASPALSNYMWLIMGLIVAIMRVANNQN